MKIREQLIAELSHFNMHYIADALGSDPDQFGELIHYVLNDRDPVPPRAAWVAEIISGKNPEIATPWIPKLIEGLESFTHSGTRRNVLKILMRHEIPEDEQGVLIDICFRWLMKEEIKVATKIFAMQIVENHVPLYPELAHELGGIIEDQFEKNSAGFKSRGRKVLKNIEKYR